MKEKSLRQEEEQEVDEKGGDEGQGKSQIKSDRNIILEEQEKLE